MVEYHRHDNMYRTFEKYWWIVALALILLVIRWHSRQTLALHEIPHSDHVHHVHVPCCDTFCQNYNYVRSRLFYLQPQRFLVCSTPRAASVWIQQFSNVYCEMTQDCTKRELLLPDAKLSDRLMTDRAEEYDELVQSANRILMVVRDPLDRLVSSFLHACKVVKCDPTIQLRTASLYPQHWYCEMLDYSPGTHILVPLHKTTERKKLAKQILRVFSSHGANKTAIKDISKFASFLNPEDHMTSMKEKEKIKNRIMSSSRLSTQFIEIYETDYMNLNFELPTEMLKTIEEEVKGASLKKMTAIITAIHRNRKYRWY